MTDQQELAALREKRENLRAAATKYRTELERGQALLIDALYAPKSAEQRDAFPTEDGWPAYEDVINLWGALIQLENEITGLEATLRDQSAID
ncbi:MAG: hypothetical protein OXE57_16410 [Alphaproteobacteria bacterium]|nr:hypothetical protein [Alphaproteobacteria bacterium]